MSSFSEIIEENKLVLVDFYADWCGPCKTMASVLEELKMIMGETVVIYRSNVDTEPLVYTYGVVAIPTQLVFHEGEIKWRHTGIMRANELASVLERYT